MLLKLQKGESIWSNEMPFFPQDSSTRGVRRTMTTGVISSSSILPSGVVAGSTMLLFWENFDCTCEIQLIRSLSACLPAAVSTLNNGVQIKQRERKRGAEKERVGGNKVKTLVFVLVLGGKAGWPVWSLTESNFEHPFKIPAKPHPFLYLQIQS